MSSKKKSVTLKELYPILGPEDLERLDEWYGICRDHTKGIRAARKRKELPASLEEIEL